jgi:hypothetical protein
MDKVGLLYRETTECFMCLECEVWVGMEARQTERDTAQKLCIQVKEFGFYLKHSGSH